MTNLLRNPGFEADWGDEESHDVLVCRPGQAPTMEVRDNIFTPPHFVTWFYHTPNAPQPDRYDQPEVRDAHKSGDPRRVHSGEKGILLFTFYRKHWAGFFQQVQVTPGTHLRFEAWGHAWSNWNEGPHPDDPRWSEGAHVGYEVVALREGAAGLDDADRNFTFSVGIDPTGGTDPFADTVVWGEKWHCYNEYRQQLSVEATAKAATVTVFLQSKTLWGYKHNDAYWDDAALVQITDEPPAYASTMLVLPQDATPEQLAEILKIAHPKKRTIGHSHDDAGVLSGTAVLYNIPQADRQRYLDWYANRYPCTKVEFAQTSDWDDDGLLIWQCNSRWKDRGFGSSSCAYTICKSGCFICGLAMVQRFYNILLEATPVTVDIALGPEGYTGCRAIHAAMPEALGLEIVASTTDTARVNAWLDSGKVALCEVQPTSLEHFVLVTRREGDRYWALDPWGNEQGWLDEMYDGAEGWRLVQPAEAPIPPLPSVPVFISFQQQRAAAYRDEFISRVQPPAWLLIGGFEEAAHLKSLAPNMEIAIRHVDNDWKSYVLASDKDAAAERWLRRHGQTLFDQAEHIKWVLDLNEYTATNDYESLRATPSWIEALVKRFEKENWPARLIGLNVPVGNPQHDYLCDEQGIPRQIPILTPAVRLLTDNDCLTGYHSYFGVRKLGSKNYYSTLDQPASVRMHYAFRALLSWDPVFTAAGVYPQYAFTEGGPIYINEAGAMVSSGAGWKYRETFDGDVDACVASYLQFQSLMQEWNAEHGNRARWLTAFIHGGFSDWKYFCMSGEPSRKLADALTV